MGRRSRRRAAGEPAGPPAAPTAQYSDAAGNILVLRAVLTPASRREYAAVRAGGLDREDAWQRATEFLFERLAAGWTVSGVPIDRQKELLGRYRMASEAERRSVREALRTHVAEHFPELEAP